MHRFVVLVVILFAAAPHPVTAGDLTPAEERTARRLYLGKCAKCHRLYDPGRYTDAEWRVWMTKMAGKSKLKPGQEELLGRYLDIIRAARRPAKEG